MDAVALALPVLIALVAVALAFDFLNGLHDAANTIAPSCRPGCCGRRMP
jgi:PiT family inorganic phosphate transporter